MGLPHGGCAADSDQASERLTRISTAWQSAKVVRMREKISFFYGVNLLVFTALLFGCAPECVHNAVLVMLLTQSNVP